MRIFKSHPFLKLANSYLVDSPQPSNISYLWNFGSLLLVCLIIQIVTGVTLAMHYNPSVLEAFNSIEHIMRDVNNGWLIRYLHSNTASAFFFLVYLHIGRGIYYGSYRSPRTLVWTLGTIIFILMILTGFLGYVLPYGQMSLWGATVITNLMSAIPWIGQDIVEFLWGGFSVNNATLNRFFALHYLLPFILAAFVLMHLIALHDSAGSSNPLGISANYDKITFAPYYLFKDLVTIFIFIIILSVFVFFMPNILGDSDNYVMANPMQTPPAIVPEWYLLPFYAILRSIPNKLLGVIAMFSAIIILLALPYTDLSRSRGMQFRPLSKITFYMFVANFLILMQLGAKHVESPFIELGQISTIFYFAYFLILMPFVSLFENSLIELTLFKNIKSEDMSSEFVVLKSGFDEVLKNIFGKFVNKKIFRLFIAILSATAVSFIIRYIFKYFNIDLFAILPHELSVLIIPLTAIFSLCMPSILDLLSTEYHILDLIKKMPSSIKKIISIFNDRSAYGPITFESNKMHMGSMDSMMDSGKTPSPKPVETKLKVHINARNLADIVYPVNAINSPIRASGPLPMTNNAASVPNSTRSPIPLPVDSYRLRQDGTYDVNDPNNLLRNIDKHITSSRWSLLSFQPYAGHLANAMEDSARRTTNGGVKPLHMPHFDVNERRFYLYIMRFYFEDLKPSEYINNARTRDVLRRLR